MKTLFLTLALDWGESPALCPGECLTLSNTLEMFHMKQCEQSLLKGDNAVSCWKTPASSRGSDRWVWNSSFLVLQLSESMASFRTDAHYSVLFAFCLHITTFICLNCFLYLSNHLILGLPTWFFTFWMPLILSGRNWAHSKKQDIG
jgi:hypothetical protein